MVLQTVPVCSFAGTQQHCTSTVSCLPAGLALLSFGLGLVLFFCSQIRLWNFNVLPCSSCSLSPFLLGCLSLLLTVCCFGWFFPNCPCLYLLGQSAFYYFLHIVQRFCMHFSFLSEAHPFLLFSIICRTLSVQPSFSLFPNSLPSRCPCKSSSHVWNLSHLEDLTPGDLIYYLRPFHYLNLLYIPQLLLFLALTCSPIPASSDFQVAFGCVWGFLCF